MYIDKEQKIYSIFQNIKIDKCINIREIYEDALKYEYIKDDVPIIFRESNIKRILVNSIRHNYSNYNNGLKQIHLLNDSEDLYFRYKNITLNKIADQYPFLKYECDRQKYDINMVKIV